MGSKIRKDLVGVVHAYNDAYDSVVLAAGDKVPDGFFVGEHLLKAAKDETEPTEPVTPTTPVTPNEPVTPAEPVTPTPSTDAPPRNGKGSGKDAWAAYAESIGVVIEADWSRDDITAAVDAAAAAAS